MTPTRATLNRIVFGTDTRAGRLFDVAVIICIIVSVAAALLDSVPGIRQRFHATLYLMEWLFTILFTLEYGLRLYCSPSPRRQYVFSFFGLVDLFAILPTYLSLMFPGANYLLVLRLLRVLRIFRILKLVRFMEDANVLLRALVNARRKILVFLFCVIVLNVVFGSLMYVIEGPANGFTSIPVSIYWAIVTMTTVGYGDISPHTGFGRLLASIAMITGYAIIAVPTGIVSSELINEFQNRQRESERDFAVTCQDCGRRGHDRDALHCKQCGATLPL
ncbi:MAG: ion transporter [Gammaproteobacteria bacterium]